MIYSHLWMDGKRAFFQATNALHGPSPITVPETAINRTGLVHVGFDLSRHGMVEGRQIDSSLWSWSRGMADCWPRRARGIVASSHVQKAPPVKRCEQREAEGEWEPRGTGPLRHFRAAL